MKTSASRPIDRLIRPFIRFAELEASGGLLLMLCTAIALLWSNSDLGYWYEHLWETHFGLTFEGESFSKSLHHWINDGLMAIFFFVVGLEIKHEILNGELSNIKKATLPIAGAIGGMILPAFFFLLFNKGLPSQHGWGIPMATDIAFALGVLTLVGDRVPIGLKVFLTALAIVDDIGAVLVIAVFYTDDLSLYSFLLGNLMLLFSFILNRMGVRYFLPYAIIGVITWFEFLQSGVHATVAGVLLAMTIPSRRHIDGKGFKQESLSLLKDFPDTENSEAKQQQVLQELEIRLEALQPPSQRLEHMLQPWVVFFIMPIFALANGGLHLTSDWAEHAVSPVSIGVFLGLFLGKQLGIFGFSWLAVRFRLASLPQGVRFSHLYGACLLGGIGFTMSLFIANLGLSDPDALTQAKLAIFIASVCSGVIGYGYLRWAYRK